jgi:hypothetical protein
VVLHGPTPQASGVSGCRVWLLPLPLPLTPPCVGVVALGGVALPLPPAPPPRTTPRRPAPAAAVIGCTQRGHVCLTFSQLPTQSAWNECSHGNFRSSSPFSNSPKHIEHVVFENASPQDESKMCVGRFASTRSVRLSCCSCLRWRSAAPPHSARAHKYVRDALAATSSEWA